MGEHGLRESVPSNHGHANGGVRPGTPAMSPRRDAIATIYRNAPHHGPDGCGHGVARQRNFGPGSRDGFGPVVRVTAGNMENGKCT